MNEGRWSTYVRDVTRDASQLAIAKRTGIHQTTISRWLNNDTSRPPSARAAVHLARAYGANPLDALIASEIITRAEAGMTTPQHIELDTVPVDVLARELARRAGERVA